MNFSKAEQNVGLEFFAEWLSYDPISGQFKWIKAPGRNVVRGSIAGSIFGCAGYRRIRLQGYSVRAHRLAWLFVHGKWPDDELDHINGHRDDNRIINLRIVDRITNSLNRLGKKGGLPIGVCYRPAHYVVNIYHSGSVTHIGKFDTKKDAIVNLFQFGKKLKGKIWVNRMLDRYGDLL